MQSINKFFNHSAEKLLKSIFKKIHYGQLEVVFPSGRKAEFLGNERGLKANIQLHNFLLIKKLFNKGSVGFAESYMDGDFTTNDLKNLLFFARKNEPYFFQYNKGKLLHRILSKVNNYINQNSKKQSKKNISYHYDLGNKFYELWLDKTMSYSSGFYLFPEDDLSKAQINKYKKIVEPMRLNDQSTLLDIGCGWGGFSSYVAKNFGSKIKAITNSKNHFEYTSQMIQKEGLNEKVKVEFQDYRDVKDKFDYISSIEMFEAVGKKYWPIYFDKIKNSLNGSGIANLQIITINECKRESYQKNQDFIQKYIFPGGVLPSKKQIIELANFSGLELREVYDFGDSYANTLNEWNKKFQNTWYLIAKQGFPKRFKRMWEYYFAYCEVGFTTKTTDVSHFLLKL